MTLAGEQYGALADDRYCLGEVPDFQGLLPKAHDAGVPIFELTDAEIRESGTVLTNFKQRRDEFKERFEQMAQRIVSVMAYA